ncbi:MAG: septum formation protein Maf [Candidatus Omnitrophica bacterium]|nr:septum formation protein Maf [Sinomicrobium sp.]MCB9799156.1 septum formation protein Maf [Candidatus Omnitrophota bacterium]
MIYLASQSARRRDILTAMGIPFKPVRSKYREAVRRVRSPEDLALEHACYKALYADIPKHARWILGADTVVWCRKQILGKPKDEKQALKMLSLLSGRTHEVITGVALWDCKKEVLYAGYARTSVRFKKLSLRAKQNYICKTHPYDKAGGYAIQSGPRVVAGYTGSYSNIVGLPRELLRKMIRHADLGR